MFQKLRFSPISVPFVGLCLTLLGFVLRYRAAQGDLWLDEIWSLSLVAKIHSAGGVFLSIPHDNNHYLNSVWMYWLGPDASPLGYRMPAILMGTASVPAAGFAMRHSGRVATAVSMLLFALCFVMVEYSSQARGYAGLTLSELMAIGFARHIVAMSVTMRQTRAYWLMGFWMGFGFLNHFIMGMFAIGLGLWIAQVAWAERQGRGKLALADLARVFWPSAVLMAPTAFCVISQADHFTFGNHQPFIPWMYWYAYSGLLSVEFGIYYLSARLCMLTLFAVGLGLWATIRLTTRDRWFYIFFLAILPALFFTAGLMNADNMRYFAPLGIVFLLGLADLAGEAFRRSENGRFAAVSGLTLFVALNVINLAGFYHLGRGDYTGLVRTLGASGVIRYGTNQPVPVRAVLEYYGRKMHLNVQEVPDGFWCDADWLIFTELAPTSPALMADGVQMQCGTTLVRIPFPAHSISAAGWDIYHVENRKGASR